jgi:hypothetical protein
MDHICGDMNTEDQSFYFNIYSGDIVDPVDTLNTPGGYPKEPYYSLVRGKSRFGSYIIPYGFHYALNPGWEYFHGYCEFPESSSWVWFDSERRISSDTIVNCTAGSANLTVNEMYSTTQTYSKTVNGHLKLNFGWKVFKGDIGGGFSYSWAFSNTHALSRATGITVAPGREGWMDARPLKRTVRVNPAFEVDQYMWGDGQSEDGWTVKSWRGRGYSRISSYGFYLDGTADVINYDGMPAMKFIARDKAAIC